MENIPTHPCRVRCSKCDYEWTGLFLPMLISDAARVMKNLTCPHCAATSKDIRLK